MYFLGVLSLGNPKPAPKVKKRVTPQQQTYIPFDGYPVTA